MPKLPWTELLESAAPVVAVGGRRATLDNVSWSSLRGTLDDVGWTNLTVPPGGRAGIVVGSVVAAILINQTDLGDT